MGTLASGGLLFCLLSPVTSTVGKEASFKGASFSFLLRVNAVALVESGMRENISSHAGALGPMQLMPIAIEELRRTQTGACKPPKGKRAERMAQTFKHGMVWGACYLRHLERLGYTGTSQLVAYNGGPGWAKKWRKTGRMPRETAEYIKRVTSFERSCLP